LNFKEDPELREFIRKLALLNAVKYDGEAKKAPVIGKLLGERPKLRSKAQEVIALVGEIVQEVNKYPLERQKQIAQKLFPEALTQEDEVQEEGLPPLANVDDYNEIVTRFSPNPDCVLHLGSARAIILCYKYARKYDGKFLLRFEDTDPKVKKPVLKFYDLIRKDLAWLGCNPDKEYIQSDRIPIYYQYAKKLLRNNKAYVCTCSPDEFRRKISSNEPCRCRSLPPEVHLKRWKGMLDGTYQEGEAVVRINTDLGHPNPAVRDWPALRIINCEKHPHPRVGKKYRVWPLYNFACGIDDHLLGITHIIRGKEHLTNMARQKYMYQYLGWEYPEAIHYGRLKIKGASLSKSQIVKGMEQGLYTSWDDPRLATFAALRKRGITPEAISNLIVDVGPKKSDVTLSWKNLYAYNRKILDPEADRYFFVHNPLPLQVKGIPKVFKTKLRLHPDYPNRGYREYTIKPAGKDDSVTFWVSKRDVKHLKVGEMTRLMELFNIVPKEVNQSLIQSVFVSEPYEKAKKSGAQLIHWIPAGTGIPCQVVMPDAAEAEGLAESDCSLLKPDEIVQFERFGFVRIDHINTKLKAYYAHR